MDDDDERAAKAMHDTVVKGGADVSLKWENTSQAYRECMVDLAGKMGRRDDQGIADLYARIKADGMRRAELAEARDREADLVIGYLISRGLLRDVPDQQAIDDIRNGKHRC